jgi:hypothetical protein
MKVVKSALPECTIGRAGRDLFSSRKDLTVIMIPYERFSPFAKAVDDLYKAIDVPFNLIVVEGNAPDSVRSQLEKRRRKHKNIQIVYSNRPTSIGAAINLAAPHLKTKYAFIIDNEVRVPRGAMKQLLQFAGENDYGIVCPQSYGVFPKGAKETAVKTDIRNLGIRTCFLMTRDALTKLGKFDENATPLTVGIDIRMAAEELGISVCNETATRMEMADEHLLWPMDASLHSFQWDAERVQQAFSSLEKKWGISLSGEDYVLWLERKKRDLQESKNVLMLLLNVVGKLKQQTGKEQHKENHKEPLKISISKAA